jgi:methylated-DNA-protein-cysteine methyltransferase-like protein
MTDLELSPAERDAYFNTVWKIVRMIPSGKVSTYGTVAGLIPCPTGVSPEDYKTYRARWVGNAMAASPEGVPWQRVINAQGKISLRHLADLQHKLLEAEGIIFNDNERIDLKQFGWTGPSLAWLRENGLNAPDDPLQLSLLL